MRGNEVTLQILECPLPICAQLLYNDRRDEKARSCSREIVPQCLECAAMSPIACIAFVSIRTSTGPTSSANELVEKLGGYLQMLLPSSLRHRADSYDRVGLGRDRRSPAVPI